MGPQLAYVVRCFPQLSETFIVEELLALDRYHVRPLIFARDRSHETTTNPKACDLLDRVVWLRDRSVPAQLGAVTRVVARHPVRAMRCLTAALSVMSRWTLLNLWFALVLADDLRRTDVRYLHAHFADDAGE